MTQITKEILIEELGVHFENLYHLPPLATRIYATLILNGDSGLTFESLIELTEASKSSVSTSISLLLQTDKIEYFTKQGDRKRYFKKKSNHLEFRLANHKSLIDKEVELFEKTVAFMKKSNEKDYKKSKEYITIYMEHLKASKSLIENTLFKLEQTIKS